MVWFILFWFALRLWEQVAKTLSSDDKKKAIKKKYIVAWNPGPRYKGQKKTYKCSIHMSIEGEGCPSLIEWRKSGDTYDLFEANGNSHATEVHNFVSYTFTLNIHI